MAIILNCLAKLKLDFKVLHETCVTKNLDWLRGGTRDERPFEIAVVEAELGKIWLERGNAKKAFSYLASWPNIIFGYLGYAGSARTRDTLQFDTSGNLEAAFRSAWESNKSLSDLIPFIKTSSFNTVTDAILQAQLWLDGTEKQRALQREKAKYQRLATDLRKKWLRMATENKAFVRNDNLQRLEEKISEMQKKIRKIDRLLTNQNQAPNKPVTSKKHLLKQFRDVLGDREAMVGHVSFENGLYVWYVTRRTAGWRRLDVKAEALRKLIGEARKSLNIGLSSKSNNSRGYIENSELDAPIRARMERNDKIFDTHASNTLYNILFGQIEKELIGIKHLIVVPSGPLQSIPFSVLVTKKPEHSVRTPADYANVDWLIKKFAITVLPSVSSLRALREFGKSARDDRQPFIGFGDPALRGGSRRRRSPGQMASSPVDFATLFRGRRADVKKVNALPRLPDTAIELERIAQSLGATSNSIFLGANSTESKVKTTRLDKYKVVAFATHGLVAGEITGLAEPALVFTPPKTATKEDDGLLTASEITTLKLDADWVILSACNTAASDGSPNAEALSGLARAFFYAGARSLLVSHWPVESRAAVRLTTGAFEALAKDPAIGRAEALRRSMLALMRDPSNPNNSHPRVWAPFMIIGEGAPDRPRATTAK